MVPSRVFHRLGRRLREAQELGSYQLVELLGHGGMGEVWRAQHRLLARDAAIKLVRPEVLGAGTDADARQVLRRFEREARATAALTLSAHDSTSSTSASTNEGTFYYVMELLSGRDLETFVRDFGPLPAERAIFLLRQVCSFAGRRPRPRTGAPRHQAGQHLRVPNGPRVRLREGARLRPGEVQESSGGESRRWRRLITRRAGRRPIWRPKIILGEADVDRRADVYALGCVAYYPADRRARLRGGHADEDAHAARAGRPGAAVSSAPNCRFHRSSMRS